MVFVLCTVQFLWLTQSLLRHHEHEHDHDHDHEHQVGTTHHYALDASVTTSSRSTLRSLASFRNHDIFDNNNNSSHNSSHNHNNDKAPVLRSVATLHQRHELTVVGGGSSGKVRRRRKGSRITRWDPGEGLKDGPQPLKVGLPIFVASLPKSGTTSIWQYFQCGGWAAAHQWTKIRNESSSDPHHQLIGKCIYDNLHKHRRPPFEECGGQAVYTDTGFARFHVDEGPSCYYPSISALDDIYHHYPNATIVLTIRDSSSWANSMMQWGNGTLLQRWKTCGLEHISWPNEDAAGDVAAATKAAMMQFYDWHTQHIRNFVRTRDMTYIEAVLESNFTGQYLQDRIGLPSSCWGKCTPLSKFCQRLVTTQR